MALDAYSARQQVLANNIANSNVDTYRPLRLNFEEQLGPLQAAVETGAGAEELKALIAEVRPFAEAADADPVTGDRHQRLDESLTRLAQNTVQYEAMLTAVNRDLSLTRVAISGEG
jgi:flagellar basal-body rod protein FlgB